MDIYNAKYDDQSSANFYLQSSLLCYYVKCPHFDEDCHDNDNGELLCVTFPPQVGCLENFTFKFFRTKGLPYG